MTRLILNKYDLLVRDRADMNLEGDTARLELVGDGDVVSKETVSRHLDPDHARQHRPRVQTDPHLWRQTRETKLQY